VEKGFLKPSHSLLNLSTKSLHEGQEGEKIKESSHLYVEVLITWHASLAQGCFLDPLPGY
jgi:hypothetical protein